MKKFLVNISLATLLSLSIIFSLISITLLNDDYIIWIFDKNNLYSNIVTNIDDAYDENALKKDYDTDQVKKDLDTYIANRYVELKMGDREDKKIYYDHIHFMGKNDIKKYSYILYAITLIIIIITGNIFLHTKKKHNLDLIFLFSSLILILFSGYVYIFVDLNNDIFNIILNNANHFLLGIGVVLLELVFLKYLNIIIHKKITIKK